METRRFVNPYQPQTLQIAVILLYIKSFFLALAGGIFSVIGLALVGGGVAAGYGIANEKKWGYGLGIAMALLPFVWRLWFFGLRGVFGVGIISLMFEIALVALLLHPMSRDYQRIWFK